MSGAQPTITGPITGGTKGYAFGRPLADISTQGYVEEEYFVEGEATRYTHAAGSEPGRDPHWVAEPVESKPYKTRLVVYRPADPEAFNGTVVLSWNNVTAGYELFGGDTPEMLEGGFAFVGASVQRAGIDGLPPMMQGLRSWDAERYDTLSIPSDDYSYDIFTQIAHLVGPQRSATVDPLGGLGVSNVVATGGSQSAMRLATYVNAIYPLDPILDGFLLTIHFGRGTPLEVGDAMININPAAAGAGATAGANTAPGGRRPLQGEHLLRTLDVPVFVVNSELEAISCYEVRQPDTDTFRYWEAAGTCHVSEQSLRTRAIKYRREFGTDLPIPLGINRVPMVPLFESAIHHLHEWVNGGEAPPETPKIDFDGQSGEPVRDEHGLAVGGIRLPQVEAPLAKNSAIPRMEGIYGLLYGSSQPFSAEMVRSLYPDEATYLARFSDAARAAEKAGLLLPRDAEALIAAAPADYAEAIAAS